MIQLQSKSILAPTSFATFENSANPIATSNPISNLSLTNSSKAKLQAIVSKASNRWRWQSLCLSRKPSGAGIVYKVRLKNSDVQKGKSGGYRALYYLKSQNKIVLVAIYSKSDRTDIDAATIVAIITQYENQFLN